MTAKLKDAGKAFLEHQKTQGWSDSSIYTYGKDLNLILAYFKPDKELVKILPVHIAGFLKSDDLLKTPKGAPKADPTVKKCKRFFRMFMEWALETGLIEKLPFPKDAEMGRKAGKESKQKFHPMVDDKNTGPKKLVETSKQTLETMGNNINNISTKGEDDHEQGNEGVDRGKKAVPDPAGKESK